MRRSLNTETYYLNKWNNEPVKVFCSSYLLNIVFPSKSRSIPLDLRKSLRDYFCYYNSYKQMLGLDNQFSDESKKLFLKYHRFCFLPTSGKADLSYSWYELARRMIDCKETISKFDDVGFDIDVIDDLDRRRTWFLGKLYSVKPEVDIKTKAHIVRSKFNRRHATEIL